MSYLPVSVLCTQQVVAGHRTHATPRQDLDFCLVSGLLSAGEEGPPLAGCAAAITDPGGERHLATLGFSAVEAEVVDVVPQLTHVLVQPLPLLKWVQVILV